MEKGEDRGYVPSIVHSADLIPPPPILLPSFTLGLHQLLRRLDDIVNDPGMASSLPCYFNKRPPLLITLWLSIRQRT